MKEMKPKFSRDSIIGLEYYRGVFDENILSNFKNEFEESNIELIVIDKTARVTASFEDFKNQIAIILSIPLIQNVFTNGSYDLFKSMIIWL